MRVELDAEQSNFGRFSVRKKAANPERVECQWGANFFLCTRLSRCETGAALVRDDSVSANPELCQGFQIALVSA